VILESCKANGGGKSQAKKGFNRLRFLAALTVHLPKSFGSHGDRSGPSTGQIRSAHRLVERPMIRHSTQVSSCCHLLHAAE